MRPLATLACKGDIGGDIYKGDMSSQLFTTSLPLPIEVSILVYICARSRADGGTCPSAWQRQCLPIFRNLVVCSLKTAGDTLVFPEFAERNEVCNPHRSFPEF